jgi:uncharacterized protein (DUF433 family)
MEPATEANPLPQPPAAPPAPVSREHIAVRPCYCGGEPHIAGHRIKVRHIVVWHERMGMSPAEIVATYPTLTLADVHAALAYYHDHRDEILAAIADEERDVDEQMAKAPPSKLEQLLRQRKAECRDESDSTSTSTATRT